MDNTSLQTQIESRNCRREYHIPIEDNNQSIVERLSIASGLSRQKTKQAMQKGASWLTRGKKTKRVRRAKAIPKTGDILHFYYDKKILSEEPLVPKLIADEGDYSIWNKPCGMLSQGSKWADHCTINRWVEQNLAPARPCFIVHRLDRAANGLIMLAHSKAAAKLLSGMFEARTIKKCYLVKVHGIFPDKPPITTVTTPLEEKSACTHIKLLHCDENTQVSYLEVMIESGRKHQIRKHLSGLGFPVVGDRLYGNPKQNGSLSHQLPDLQLQAYYLSFNCPLSGEPKTYQLSKC